MASASPCDKGTALSRPTSETIATCSSKHRRKWLGWHYIVIGGASAVSFSLLCNIILLVVGLARYNAATGRGQLSGSCENLPSLDRALHVVINILSTLALGASNAGMQCLSAPTRKDLDKLHARGQYADIGINGFRNLRIMSHLRRTLWALLLLSSIPLHLMYNSVVVSSLTSWAWAGYLVTGDFTQGGAQGGWNQTLLNISYNGVGKVQQLQGLAIAGELDRLDRTACMQAFATDVYSYSSVLFVAEDAAPTPRVGSVLGLYQASDEGNWGYFSNFTFMGTHNISNATQFLEMTTVGSGYSFTNAQWPLLWNGTALWNPTNSSAAFAGPSPDFSIVSYCLAQRVPEYCSVDTLPTVQAMVVLLNVTKLVCLLIILYKVPEQPLITQGDAITSFLEDQAPAKKPVDILRARRWISPKPAPPWKPSSKRHRWARGASPLRWALAGIICLSGWALGMFGAIINLQEYGGLGEGSMFDRYNPYAIDQILYPNDPQSMQALDDPTATSISSIIIANSPQLLLSIAYFQYTGLITAMLLSREWTNLARYRKGLRVSSPKGAQRGSFWLSLPYAYNVPVLALAGVLHWLLSESIYYQELNVLDGTTVFPPSSGDSVFPSNFLSSLNGIYLKGEALLVFVIVFAVGIVAVLLAACRRYAGGMPLVRSNSFALSCACASAAHREDPYLPLQWGWYTKDGGGLGLSSTPVEMVDVSSLRFNAIERLINRWKKDFHKRVGRAFSHKRRPTHETSSDEKLLRVDSKSTLAPRIDIEMPDDQPLFGDLRKSWIRHPDTGANDDVREGL